MVTTLLTSRRFVTSGFTGVLEGPATLDPERIALVADGRQTTYGELAAMVARCEAGLAAAGLAPGQRVVLAEDAGAAATAVTVAAARLGAAAALMNPRLTTGELWTLMEAAGHPRLGVTGGAHAAELGAVGDLKVLGLAELAAGGSSATPGTVTRTSVTAAATAGAPGDEAGEALVLFTSGTTGTPKAVSLSHAAMGDRIRAFSPAFDPRVPASVALMCVPLVHIGGVLGLLVSLARGHTTVVQTRFDPGEWLVLVERHRVQACFLVPTMLHRILEHPALSRTDLSSLSMITYGAAPAPPALIARAVEALPHVSFSNVFGQTETLGSITALGPEDHRPGAGGRIGSVGRPLPGVETRIVDAVGGTDVPAGEVGELWVRAPAMAEGPAVVAGGWLRTGDLVRSDPDGYLYPAGRLSDTINRGGEKFAPAEIEEVLADHPAVADVAVAGVPDAEMGSRVGAAVVARRPVTAGELREHCRGRLAAFKLPEMVAFVEELPYNDFGKVSRRALAEVILGAAAAGRDDVGVS